MMDTTTDWFSEDVATFGDRLAAARDAAGLDVKALAHRLGVKTSTVRKWEDDMAEPRANKLSMLAGVLGVSMSWLIMGEGDGPAPDTDTETEEDARALLEELRVLRASLLANAEKVGRMEKRVRAALGSIKA